MSISVIKKRDGRIVPFDVQKITNAIEKSFRATDAEKDWEALSTELALEVYTLLDLEGNPAPSVEHVQDLVEQVLMREGHVQTAKNYILYRQERSRIRQRSDEQAARFGGAPLALTKDLQGCHSIETAVFATFRILQERSGHAVCDFPQAMTPAVAGSFEAQYRQALQLSLELLTGIRVHESTQLAWKNGLVQRQLAITLAEEKAALAREADLICGTLGCDREPVEQAQKTALHYAKQAVQTQLCEAVTRLCAAVDMEPSVLQGTADTPEAQLILTALTK